MRILYHIFASNLLVQYLIHLHKIAEHGAKGTNIKRVNLQPVICPIIELETNVRYKKQQKHKLKTWDCTKQ
jgi:hypothetical protein